MFIYWAVIIALVFVVLHQAETISDLRTSYELEIRKNKTYAIYQCPMYKEEKES